MLKVSTRHRFFAQCTCCSESFAQPGLNRRELLAGGAAIGAAAVVGFGTKVIAQPKPHRIDVHHHVAPPTWLDAVKSRKMDNPPMANWSVQKSLDDMDKGGVATAVTSLTTP
jgi:6-methylsalicylate decarboxylase